MFASATKCRRAPAIRRFGTIPLQNSPLYSENELRFSAQQSRIALKASGDIDPTRHVKGYYEMDFLGAALTANSRESNSYTPRIRQAYFAYDDDNWHGPLQRLVRCGAC